MNTPPTSIQSYAREKLERAMANGGVHLGDLVWPEVRLASARIPREHIERLLEKAGLPTAWAPEMPSGQKAFGAALSRCRNFDDAPNVTIERESLRSRIALVRHSVGVGVNKETSTWARIEVGPEDDLQVDWSPRTSSSVAYNIFPSVKLAVDALAAEYNAQLDYTSPQEVGSMITTVLQKHLCGTRIRQDGGLYFVPSEMGTTLRQFAAVVGQVASSRLPFLPAFDTVDTRSNVGASVSDTLHSEVQRIRDGLRKLGSSSRGPRQDSLQRRLDELDALSTRAEACRIVLADYSEDIATAVQNARAHVLSMMEGCEEG